MGIYSEILEDELGESAFDIGIGGGVVLGFEADGGFYVALQADSVTVEIADAENELIGTRVHIGFRF